MGILRLSLVWLWPLALLLAMSGACRRGPTAPSEDDLRAALPRSVTTDHYVFRHAEGDTIHPDAQEGFHRWVEDVLGTPFRAPITYNKYRDRAQMQALTGLATNGWADPPALTVHSIHPADAHEAVHVITFAIGRPTDFWNEGIAVALNQFPGLGITEPSWQGRPVHLVAADFLAAGRVPSLTTILATDPFRGIEEARGYPIAGSFVWYLIERSGIDPLLLQFRGASRGDSSGVVVDRFERAYGRTLTTVDQEWRSFLASR
jgi:hypothetical protein